MKIKKTSAIQAKNLLNIYTSHHSIIFIPSGVQVLHVNDRIIVISLNSTP